jgi:hypothetical protein
MPETATVSSTYLVPSLVEFCWVGELGLVFKIGGLNLNEIEFLAAAHSGVFQGLDHTGMNREDWCICRPMRLRQTHRNVFDPLSKSSIHAIACPRETSAGAFGTRSSLNMSLIVGMRPCFSNNKGT